MPKIIGSISKGCKPEMRPVNVHLVNDGHLTLILSNWGYFCGTLTEFDINVLYKELNLIFANTKQRNKEIHTVDTQGKFKSNNRR